MVELRPFWLALFAILASSRVRADDDPATASQRQVAGVVTIAKTAPILCSWIEADDTAIQQIMDHVQITEKDLMRPDRFGPDDEALARSFAKSQRSDPDFCAKVFVYLGDRAHLVRRKAGN